jgi:hypothetical protein
VANFFRLLGAYGLNRGLRFIDLKLKVVPLLESLPQLLRVSNVRIGRFSGLFQLPLQLFHFRRELLLLASRAAFCGLEVAREFGFVLFERFAKLGDFRCQLTLFQNGLRLGRFHRLNELQPLLRHFVELLLQRTLLR